MQNQHPDIEWRNETVPVSTQFDDPYYSLENGLDETRHVFLHGNDLPDRFRDGFHIGELGFGTGLNFLATWQSWRASGAAGTLRFSSFEAYPMRKDDIAQALEPFAELADFAQDLVGRWTGSGGQFEFDGVELNLITGDARDTLPRWAEKADAWYLDGFSPAKNPELWEPDLMAQVAAHTVKGGSIATYTAAGFVRRGLQEAGFSVTRVAGYGRKRHMTKAILE